METYEEKYKDLVKRLNKAREEKGVYTFNSVLDVVAPELKIDESEDERIRKELLNYLYDVHDDDEERARWIAWLEKQGEQNPAWSEEDKCMLNNVINTLEPLSQTTHSGYAINSMIAWLKSLRHKN